MQALNLAQSVRMQPLDLPLVIDIEQWTNPSGHSADSVLRHAAQMAHTLENKGTKWCSTPTNRDKHGGYAES